jgi:endogenous inhibitor of DNA gyrase (YacG/DUF329 family)
MATITRQKCPHCASPLAYMEGVSGASLHPPCPRCGKPVTVKSPTTLSADYSRQTG